MSVPGPPEGDTPQKQRSPRVSSWATRVEHKFKFLTAHEPKGIHDTVFNLKPKILTTDSPVIACSTKWWAVPYEGGGGPVFVSPIAATGVKVEPATAHERCLNGHKAPVAACAFSSLDPDLLATAGDDCQVCVWRVFSAGETTESEDPVIMAGGHGNSVRDACFHPTVAGALATASSDGEVALWSVDAAAAVRRMKLPAATSALDWSYDGSLLLASCRDRTLRAVDPRSERFVFEARPHGAASKSFRAKWAQQQHGSSHTSGVILSAGGAARGGRELAMLDVRKLTESEVDSESNGTSAVLFSKHVDNQTGALLPHFSEATKMLWLFGRGDTTIRHFEIEPTASTADEAFFAGLEHRVSSGAPHAGFAALPARVFDVAALEVARFVRLTSDAVSTVAFTVPRTKELKEYFNDDVYGEAREAEPAVPSCDAWLAVPEASAPPRKCSLRPDNMPLLSERVVEKKVLNTQLVNARLSTERDRKASDQQQYDKLKALADQYEKYQPNNSMGARPGVDAQVIDGAEVDDDEWDD